MTATSVLPVAQSRTAAARIPRCPQCSSRRWTVVERGAQLQGWCLSCGLAAGDLLALTAAIEPVGSPSRRARPGAGGLSPQRGRDPVLRGGHDAVVRWVAHAGLGARRPGGTPTRKTLDRALALGVDAVELDVCTTGDGTLVARHDVRLARRCQVSDLTLAELRGRQPETLTLSEAVEQVTGRIPVLIDVKQEAAVQPLARWLAGRRQIDELAVCAPSRGALEHLRRRAPRVARWQTLPSLGTTPATGTAHVLWSIAGHFVRGQPFYVSSELLRAGVLAVDSPRRAARHLVSSPWRGLPEQLTRLTAATAPVGLCVDHRLLSPALLSAAAERGLQIVAWTINTADALRDAVTRGVRTITTDEVVSMRLALAGPGR